MPVGAKQLIVLGLVTAVIVFVAKQSFSDEKSPGSSEDNAELRILSLKLSEKEKDVELLQLKLSNCQATKKQAAAAHAEQQQSAVAVSPVAADTTLSTTTTTTTGADSAIGCDGFPVIDLYKAPGKTFMDVAANLP
eukprot:355063_1